MSGFQPEPAHGCQHAHVSRRARMRTVRPLIAGAAASAATLAVLGLTATAQAEPASLTAVTHTYSVPLGVETAVNLTGCASGTTVRFGDASPAGHGARGHQRCQGQACRGLACHRRHHVYGALQDGTKTTNKLTVLAAPQENAAVGVGSDTIQTCWTSSAPITTPRSRARPLPASTAGTPPTPTPGRSATPSLRRAAAPRSPGRTAPRRASPSSPRSRRPAMATSTAPATPGPRGPAAPATGVRAGRHRLRGPGR